MKEQFSTDRFVISHSTMASALFQLYGKLAISLLAIVMIMLFIIGITSDIRWIIVSLMVGFIIAPLLLAFLYFFNALTPVTSANVLPHSVENRTDGKIKVTFWQQVLTEDDKGTELWEPHLSREIPESSLRGQILLLSHLALIFENPHKGFLLIPLSFLSEQLNSLKPQENEITER